MISNIHKSTHNDYLKVVEDISNIKNSNNNNINLLNPKLILFVQNYIDDINNIIDYNRDYIFDYFGINTLLRSYLIKDELIIERPQHLFMRVAIGIHLNHISDDGIIMNNNINLLNEIKEVYDCLSNKLYTHATPTLFNAGFRNSTLSSCYLLDMEDNLSHIYKVLSDTANISKYAGGIGISISKICAKRNTY